MRPASQSTPQFLVLLLAALSIGAFTTQAREGFYLGAGFASVSASGDLKGNTFVTNTAGTEAEILGSLSSGTGIALEVGYGFNRYIGIEYLGTGTRHTASTDKKVIPANDTAATVGTALFGFRLTAPVAKSFELFARFGMASSTVMYDEYSVPGTTTGTVFTPSGKGGALTLSGAGSGYGAGFEILGEHLGFELAYTVYDVSFDRGKGVHSSGSLPKAIKETLSAGTAIVAYHF